MSSDINLWETGVNNDGNGTDNNQYYISDSVNRLTIQRGTGNIGIGTDAPLHLLDVRGNINITGKYLLNGFDAFNDTSNYVLQTSNLVSNNLNIAINDTSNYVLQTSNLVSNNLNIAINDTSNYVLQTSNLVSANLNQAISDTSNYVLQTSNLVSNNLNIAINDTSNYVLQTSNLVSNNLNIAINDTSNYVANLSADEIADGVNNKFIIDGIYSNNFEVNGNIKATSIEGTGANITTINADNITSGTLDNARMPKASDILLGGVKVGNNTAIDEFGKLSVDMSTYTGDVEIIGDLTTSNLTILGDSTTLETNVFTTERLEINNIGTGTGISVTQSGGTDDIFTASNSSREVFNIINNGNVGIGITNPSVSLHVAGTDGIVVPVGTDEERPTENIKGLIRYNTTTLSFEGYGSTWGSLGGVKDVDGDTYISAENDPGDNNDELKFYTSNFERMVITSNGLIGIGTTNPTVELDVNGDINTDYITTHNINIINTDTDSPSLKITHNTLSNDILQITDTSSKQYLTLTHEGNVGIGTNIPSALLHIYNTNNVLKASNTEITINRSIIPETNDTVDIGSAEKKIRDMYISNNSLWIGDEHKLTITSDGIMKFRKRNKTVLPKTLINAFGTSDDAITHVNQTYGTSFSEISELKLYHILSYANTINPEYKTSDIFGDDIDDYELDTAADAWQINSSKIFLGTNYTNIGIGTNNPDPYYKLDVAGNVNAVGTISADDITIKGTIEKGSGAIKLNCEYNSHGVSIKGPPHSDGQNYTLTLPSTAPEENKVLTTDIYGNLSWVTYRLDNLDIVDQSQESIDGLKALLGISTYEITDISPVFLDLTITTSNKETLDDGVEYMKPIIFTIYGKNFDRNVVIKLCLYDDTNTLKERDINTIYHDSSIQLRVSTKYIPIDVINNASYFKLMMYDKNYPEKKILSREIYRDVHKPEWLYDNDYEVIYNKEFGFKFTINDSDTSNILLYELTDGTHLIPDLSFNSETGEITGVPEILNTTVNLSMNAKSGSQFLTTRNYKLHILSNPIIDNTENQELLVYNTFDLSATSGAESFLSISGVNTSITWSLIGGDTENISLSDNTIEVTDLNLLGDSGTDITVQATDAYGYSITKLINVKRTILNGPTINTAENQELLVYNYFDLSATSDVVTLDNPEADTSITWSLIGYNNITEISDTLTYYKYISEDNTEYISLSGNTITVTNLNLLGVLGTDIIVEAKDAYDFKNTKTINVIKTILNGPTIQTGDQELSSNTFDLSATSAAESISGANTSITWSLISGDTANISLSGNTIEVTDLNLLGDSGTDITVQATDAYGYSTTKTINIKYLSSFLVPFASGANNKYQNGNKTSSWAYGTDEILYFINNGIKIQDIILGQERAFFITNDRNIYAIGNNNNGELGLEHSNFVDLPQLVPIPNNAKIKNIVSGSSHTIFLTEGGLVYAVGNNGNGQLGQGNYIASNKKLLVTFPNNITISQISGGANHVLCIASDYKIYGFGYNVHGQLGLSPNSSTDDFTNDYNTPQLLTYFEADGRGAETNKININNIVCGSYHTIFIADDNTNYCVGNNAYGQLGKGDTTKISYPQVMTSYEIKQVACGNYHTIILTNDNKIYSMGINSSAELGLTTITSDGKTTPQLVTHFDSNGITINQIACGHHHTIFLSDIGNVYGCGYNGYGQLGLGYRTSPITTPTLVTELSISNLNVKKIRAAINNTMLLVDIVKYENQFYVAGNNSAGYLLPGNEENQPTPQLFTFFIKTTITIKDVSTSGSHTAFLTNEGKVYTMGANGYGQLGLGNNGIANTDTKKTPQLVSFLDGIIIDKIYCKYNRSFFITSDGDIYCCGINANAELGIGNNATPNTIILHPYFRAGGSRGAASPKINIIDVKISNNNTMFLTNQGDVYACGFNLYGQLGLGNTNNQSTPQKLTYFNDIFVTKIVGGYDFTMFLDTDGYVYGVGDNYNGQLGLGYTTPGSYVSDYYEKTVNRITYFDSINIEDIVCGAHHTFFLKNDGIVYCCGSNGMGVLGLGHSTSPQPTVQILTYFNNIPIKQISSSKISMFLTHDNKVYTCGENGAGELGYGNFNNSNNTTPQLISYFDNNNITITRLSNTENVSIFFNF